MANDILITHNTPIVWADSADHNGRGGTRTHQIDLTGIVTTAARQSAKADLGTPRAEVYAVTLGIEIDVAPGSSGLSVVLYWAPSRHATAGTENPGGCSGADAAYTGTAGDSIANSVKQLTHVLTLPMTTDASAVIQQITRMFAPELQYGSWVVWNKDTGQAFEANADEMFIRMEPIESQFQ